MFEFLKDIFFKDGELLSFAPPDAQREYSTNFPIYISNINGCVKQCIQNMFIVSCRQWIWNGFNSNLWWSKNWTVKICGNETTKLLLTNQQGTFNIFNYNFSHQSYYPAPHKNLNIFIFFYLDDIEFLHVLNNAAYTWMSGLNSMSL